MQETEYHELYDGRRVPSDTPVAIQGSKARITVTQAVEHLKKVCPSDNNSQMIRLAEFSRGEWACGLRLLLPPDPDELHCVGCYGPAPFDPCNKWAPMCGRCRAKVRGAAA